MYRLAIVVCSLVSTALFALPLFAQQRLSEVSANEAVGFRRQVLATAVVKQAKDLELLNSATGTLRFEFSRQEKTDAERWIQSKGTQEIMFAGGKYRFKCDFEYRYSSDSPKIGDELTYVLDDLEKVTRVTFSPRIHPSGCRVEIYDRITSACASNIIPVHDPMRLATDVANISKVIDNLGETSLSVTRDANGVVIVEGRIANRPKNRIEWILDPQKDYRLIAKRIHHDDDDRPYFHTELEWKQIDDVWYVHKFTETLSHRDDPENRIRWVTVAEFEEFHPNVEVDSEVFMEDSIDVPPNATFYDRRSGAPPRVGRPVRQARDE